VDREPRPLPAPALRPALLLPARAQARRVIGYSIFIYRLSAEEVRAATGGSLKDWSSLIERSGDG
jgi:hypothetical protein